MSSLLAFPGHENDIQSFPPTNETIDDSDRQECAVGGTLKENSQELQPKNSKMRRKHRVKKFFLISI